jgi:peptidoglycan/LPS O-acetylase OafA/YrhL
MAWLQVARAVAALMVLFFHIQPLWNGVPWLAGASMVSRYGYAGVDVFFVLSGYVVMQSTRTPRGLQMNAFGFIAQRMARLFSGYWPVLLILILGNSLVYGHPWPVAEKWITSVFLLSFDLNQHLLPTAWSLAYELYFYLLLTVLIYGLPSKHLARSIAALIGVVVFYNLGWWLNDAGRYLHNAQPFNQTLSGFTLEFFVGAALALWTQKHPVTRKAIIPAVVAATLGLACGIALPQFTDILFVRALTLGTFGTAVVMLALAMQSSNLHAPTWLQKLGDSSYALYLLHPILIGVFGVTAFALSHRSTSLAALWTAMAVPLIVIFAHLWYLLLERPLHLTVRNKIDLVHTSGKKMDETAKNST